MFINSQDSELRLRYNSLLQKVGALSRLYSDNEIPYLYYRTAERIFCVALDSNDHSRSDLAVDSSKENIGVGLKTFTYKSSGRSFEKISEFNKLSPTLRDYYDDHRQLAITLGNYYNRRIRTAINTYRLSETLFHCVVRRPGAFLICEYGLDYIDTDNLIIRNVNSDNTTGRLKTIDFEDSSTNSIYKFNTSKSTLFREFNYLSPIYEVPISIIEDPFVFLEEVDLSEFGLETVEQADVVYLPLYSYRAGDEKYVPERSGLNQWNASGRTRHPDELYIRIPIDIYRSFPDFFPDRLTPFDLRLPDGIMLSAKVCQQNNKALMSNPNRTLGEWLLRDVLEIPRGNVVTYNDLLEIGIDSVEIRKSGNGFEIDFKTLGTYEEFREQYNF